MNPRAIILMSKTLFLNKHRGKKMTSSPLPEHQNYMRTFQFLYNSPFPSRRLHPLSRMPSLTFENSSLIISYMQLPDQSPSPQKINFRFHQFHFQFYFSCLRNRSETYPFVLTYLGFSWLEESIKEEVEPGRLVLRVMFGS